jgi:hypothetical protein
MMLVEAIQAMVLLVLVVYAAKLASETRRHAENAETVTRVLRHKVEDLEIECLRGTANIKKLTAQVGGLSRGKMVPAEEEGAVPDPKRDPEGWRASVRRMAIHQQSKGAK